MYGIHAGATSPNQGTTADTLAMHGERTTVVAAAGID